MATTKKKCTFNVTVCVCGVCVCVCGVCIHVFACKLWACNFVWYAGASQVQDDNVIWGPPYIVWPVTLQCTCVCLSHLHIIFKKLMPWVVKLKGKLQLGFNFISIKRVKNKYKQNNANLMKIRQKRKRKYSRMYTLKCSNKVRFMYTIAEQMFWRVSESGSEIKLED